MTCVPGPVVASDEQLVQVRQLLEQAGLPLAGLADVWRTWVLVDSGEIIGCVALERYSSSDAPVYLLRSMAVRDDERGCGRGSALVRAALEAADEDADGTAVVALLTETAVGYFARFGFVPVARDSLSAEVHASAELSGACPDTARAFVRGP